MTEPAPLAGVDDPNILRRAFTLYPHGVMAVGAKVDGRQVGLAVSAFVSVSLTPPLVQLCIDRCSNTWPVLSQADALGVSILSEDHVELTRQLASRSPDRFAGAEVDECESGALLLRGSPARLETCIETVYEGGDHLIVLLRVLSMTAYPDIRPLVWYHSQLLPLGG